MVSFISTMNDFRLTAIVVDDVAVMRKMLRDILTSQNFDVIGEASDGQQAIDVVKEDKNVTVILAIDLLTLRPSFKKAISNNELVSPPNSLVAACEEFARIRNVL